MEAELAEAQDLKRTTNTAIAEGLAQRMVNRDVPASLIGQLFALDLGAIQAGASYKGQFEERIKSILNEVEKATEKGENIILFIDEMHLIMAGQGASSGGMDAANLIKPVLARGKLGFHLFDLSFSVFLYHGKYKFDCEVS
ncbi:hypothetical protein PGTUg99_017884 [Puccinia graminis f. sp. tritici]|uniref:ATPase AAA-type core domain-containing protein n=1 Tax=Puccinia graminis f. sp. tritici TaxID=56615 RepID=A0A5B0SHX6_PUCGR|nr:hypothetical protein PGTUg99_017884 [Puccinia graminis f. sp. tritici]